MNWKGILIQKRTEKNEKYGSDITIDNPFDVFSLCKGKIFKATVPIEVISIAISSFRKGRGMTTAEIGKSIGRYHTAIESMEHGLDNMSIKELKLYGDALDLELGITIKPKQNKKYR